MARNQSAAERNKMKTASTQDKKAVPQTRFYFNRVVPFDLVGLVQDTTFPPELGRGFLSTERKAMGRLLPVNGTIVSTPHMGTPNFGAKFLDKRSSFFESISGSLDASTQLSGGAFGFSATLSRKVKISEIQSSLLVHKTVVVHEYHVGDAPWSEEATDLSYKDIREFTKRYGDKFIQSVYTGGTMAILYDFTFSNREDALSFNAKASGGFGGSSGSASFQREVFKTARNTLLNVNGFILGTDKEPIFEVPNVKIDAKGRVNEPEGNLYNIIEYYNDFHDHVKGSISMVPVVFEVCDSKIATNPGEVQNLAEHRRLLKTIETIRDLVAKRSAELSFLEASAIDWNRHISRKEIEQSKMRFAKFESDLQSEENRILDYPITPRLKIGLNDVPPAVNGGFSPRTPKRRKPDIKLIVSEKKNGQTLTKWKVVALPIVAEDTPLLIGLNIILLAGSAEFFIHTLDEQDRIVDIVTSEIISGPYNKIYDGKFDTAYYALLKPNCRKLRITGAVRNAVLSIYGYYMM